MLVWSSNFSVGVNIFFDLNQFLAKEMDMPIVPVAIQGAYEMLPRGKAWPRYGQKIKVQFLPPIQPQPDDTYQAISERTAQAIREAMIH